MTSGPEKPAVEGGTPVRDTFLPFVRPAVSQSAITEVVETLRSGWLATGPRTARFEEQFAAYTGNRHAVGTVSGTTAIALALEAAGVGPGDEVITAPMTFVATAHQVLLRGATPVLADIDRRTCNISPKYIEEKTGKRTKALLLVHFAGRPCNMDAILSLAGQKDLLVIHDAAHAIEARYKGKPLAAMADASAFSFHPNKNLTTAEGGMVTTDRNDWADRFKVLRFHGIKKEGGKVDVFQLAGKCNMSDLQAAIGLHELNTLEERWTKRESLFNRYNEAFIKLSGIIPPAPTADQDRHALHMYNPLIDIDRLRITRDAFVDAMRAENIGVGIHYTSLHELTYYKERFGFRREDFPESAYVSDRIVTLPLFPSMTDKDQQDVIDATLRILNHYKV